MQAAVRKTFKGSAIQVAGQIMNGVFAINKPKDISSAQCLRELQDHFVPSKLFAATLDQMCNDRNPETRYQKGRRSKAKRELRVKLGHGGTLDPMATGVLIVGVGTGTKQLPNFLHGKKSYTTDVLFGAATDSFDILGRVLKRVKTSHLTEAKIREALGKFRGQGKQRPPIFSALHQDGKRLYEYAREGKKPPREIELRDVDVRELELVRWMRPGEHDFKLPEQEAEPQEKAVLNEVLQEAGRTQEEIPAQNGETGSTAKEPTAPADLKRKHEDTLEDTVFESVPRAKRRRESSEPTMAGALQSDTDDIDQQLSTENDRSSLVSGQPDEPPVAKLHMSVSSGFYVRSLCQELGVEVDSAAMMASLVRTQQADFILGKNVFEYSELAKGEDVWAPQIKNLLDDWNNAQASVERRNTSSDSET